MEKRSERLIVSCSLSRQKARIIDCSSSDTRQALFDAVTLFLNYCNLAAKRSMQVRVRALVSIIV